MSDELDQDLDDVRATAWAQGFNDRLAGRPRSPKTAQIAMLIRSDNALLAQEQAYHEGYKEAHQRREDLDRLYQLEAALDGIEMSRDSD